jgi:DNA-binding response OmpR family regulator
MNRMALGVYDILLVDDEANLLFIISDLLRIHGFSVVTAQNGASALKQLENKIGIIILDLNLAGEDGLGLMDYFRSQHPDVPIILYTGLIHDHRQVGIMLQRGASSYVNKAQPIEALLSAINEVRAKRPVNS